MNKQLIVMVGPAGAGKSTMSRKFEAEGFTYINQDSQGREHLALFDAAILEGENVVVDRMGFTKQQRSRYLDLARQHGYTTKIIVLHQPYSVCLERCLARQGHETIKDEKGARGALNMFFTKYERVQDTEADEVVRIWPESEKPLAVICDLDGTLCNVEHRRHFVRPPENISVGPTGEMIDVFGQTDPVDLQEPLPKAKKNWYGFFKAMSEDTINEPVAAILSRLRGDFEIVFCSGRPDNYRRETVQWLERYGQTDPHGELVLYMRNRSDQRQDDIVKEILLDFEILTRYTPYFVMDDRDQVVAMWRKRGYTCFQVAPGDF